MSRMRYDCYRIIAVQPDDDEDLHGILENDKLFMRCLRGIKPALRYRVNHGRRPD